MPKLLYIEKRKKRDEVHMDNISKREFAVLSVVMTRPTQEWYAWDIVKASDGQVGENMIYIVLSKMVMKGLLDERLETKDEAYRGNRRMRYKVTGAGRRAYSESDFPAGDWVPANS